MTATLPETKLKKIPSAANCPFYGAVYFEGQRGTPHPPFVLFPTEGNECAVVTNRHTPCYLEIEGQPVDWRNCVIVRLMRMERR